MAEEVTVRSGNLARLEEYIDLWVRRDVNEDGRSKIKDLFDILAKH